MRTRTRKTVVRVPREARKWIRSDADREAWRVGHRFDEDAAVRVRRFFETLLEHSKGQFAGKKFTLLDWQWEDVIAPVFGWIRPDGTRRYRTAYVEVPKKNGKSTLSSGIALYLLVGDGEMGAEVYTAAADRRQASIVFDEAHSMVDASKPLTDRLEVIPSKKRIWFAGTRSWLEALSADVPTKEGLNASGVIFDELHAQPNRKLWDTLRYAGAARLQPLTFVITTAGYDRTSIGWEVHDYADQVLRGKVRDLSFFSYIRAAGEKDDWTRPAVWRKANPSLGITIKEEDMAAACLEARQSNPKQNAFLRYRLNIWTEQIVRWIRMEKWRLSEGDAEPGRWRREALERLAGQTCVGGLDLGATGDITALSLVFGCKEQGYQILNWYWCPRMGLWRDNGTYRALYEQWVRAGYMSLTDGDVTDYAVVRRDINRLADLFGIREMAVDRQFQGAQLCTDLAGDGLEMVPFGQGFLSMAAPTKEYEELILAGKLCHGNNPIQSWMAANASVKTDDAGNLKVVKPEHGSPLKVDGIVTDIMAIGRIMATPPAKKSIYSRRAAEQAAVGGAGTEGQGEPPRPPAGRRMSIYSKRAAEKQK